VFTANPDGTNRTDITFGPFKDTQPDWQPIPGPQGSDFKNAAEFCKAEREFMEEIAFGQKYGANGNGANAFGKCVSADGR
jgi:hypothetical protein